MQALQYKKQGIHRSSSHFQGVPERTKIRRVLKLFDLITVNNLKNSLFSSHAMKFENFNSGESALFWGHSDISRSKRGGGGVCFGGKFGKF